jgi:hypothetical protein
VKACRTVNSWLQWEQAQSSQVFRVSEYVEAFCRIPWAGDLHIVWLLPPQDNRNMCKTQTCIYLYLELCSKPALQYSGIGSGTSLKTCSRSGLQRNICEISDKVHLEHHVNLCLQRTDTYRNERLPKALVKTLRNQMLNKHFIVIWEVKQGGRCNSQLCANKL